MGVDPRFALPASCRTACTGLKESSRQYKKFGDKVRWATKVHQIQYGTRPELSPGNAGEACM